jgi:hypothetical protein
LRDRFEQPRAAAVVELAQDVVQEKQRRLVASSRDGARFGQEERQNGQPLLPLRAVGTEIEACAFDREILEVRPGARDSPLEVPLEPSIELSLGDAARPVLEHCAGEAQELGLLAEEPAQLRDRSQASDVELRR